jgi:hypothetical protein
MLWRLTIAVRRLGITGTQLDTPAKIRRVIDSGGVIGGSTIVSMPHGGGIISRAERDALVAYIDTLR